MIPVRDLSIAAIICASLGAGAGFWFSDHSAQPAPYRVIDGDTIRSATTDARVRLWGIDAPEMDTAEGRRAKAALEVIIAGRPLTCERVDTDRYGREVAICRLPTGEDIACVMVAKGHAEDWPRFSGGHYAECGPNG